MDKVEDRDIFRRPDRPDLMNSGFCCNKCDTECELVGYKDDIVFYCPKCKSILSDIRGYEEVRMMIPE